MPHAGYAPLSIRPAFSPRLALYLLGVHALAVIVIWQLPLGVWRWAVSLASVLSAVDAALTQLWPRLPWAIKRVVWDGEGRWWLYEVSGRKREARLLPGTFVSPAWIVLNLRITFWNRRALVLLPDAVDGELLRRLRQRLRLQTQVLSSADDTPAPP